MRYTSPGYDEQVARTLKATLVTLEKLRALAAATSSSSSDDKDAKGPDPEVENGVPYMLRGR